MSAVPQGAFAVVKIKRNCQKPNEAKYERNQTPASFSRCESVMEQLPLRYNSKLMNSVWGLYNRYSVHNLKKNWDPIKFCVFNSQRFQT